MHEIVACRSRERKRATMKAMRERTLPRMRVSFFQLRPREPDSRSSHSIWSAKSAAGLRAFGRGLFPDFSGQISLARFFWRDRIYSASLPGCLASSVLDVFRSRLPLRGSSGIAIVDDAPDSLLGPPLGVGTAGGHKILGLASGRQQNSLCMRPLRIYVE